jgi:hypothetical protein
MKFTWTEVLPPSIRSLPPLHRDLVGQVIKLPAGTGEGTQMQGGRGTWTVTASNGLRLYFRRNGITSAADADIRYTPENCDAPGKRRTGRRDIWLEWLYDGIGPAMRISAAAGMVSLKAW